MKNFTFIIILVLISATSFGQTNTELKIQERQNAAEVKQVLKQPRNLKDGYFGYKKDILIRLINQTMPENFPRYNNGQTEDQYKELMMNWARENMGQIKEEYHKEFQINNAK